MAAEQGIEAVNAKAENWVNKANQTMAANEFAVSYTIKTIVIGDGSLPEDVMTASAYVIGEQLKNAEKGQFTDLRTRFGVDYVTYITPSEDQYGSIGAAYENAAQAVSFTAGVGTWAHEVGHSAAMEHPNNEICAETNLLMCQTQQGRNDNLSLIIDDYNANLLRASLNNQSPGYTNWLMMGHIAEPMEILGHVDLVVTGNSVDENNVGEIDFELRLTDSIDILPLLSRRGIPITRAHAKLL